MFPRHDAKPDRHGVDLVPTDLVRLPSRCHFICPRTILGASSSSPAVSPASGKRNAAIAAPPTAAPRAAVPPNVGRHRPCQRRRRRAPTASCLLVAFALIRMPIFQADLVAGRAVAAVPIDIEHGSHVAPAWRRRSPECLPPDLCADGLEQTDQAATSDRRELIERLKRRQSPAWIANRPLRGSSASPVSCIPSAAFIGQHEDTDSVAATSRTPGQPPNLLPPPLISAQRLGLASIHVDERMRDGLGTERPRSALHTGDFTHHDGVAYHHLARNPWPTACPAPNLISALAREHPDLMPDSTPMFPPVTSHRSSSLSSSFAFQPPTSPLVQSESNNELDFSLRHQRSRGHGHASPPCFVSFERSPSTDSSCAYTRRRDGSLPYQAHQPRRSLTSASSFLQHSLSSQPPALLRSRRPSLSSEASPIQHASMVGSYEESILRGRMSTTPSKPFDFIAQIGVLGRGQCKSSLRCPSHVALPFSAVYYSYSSTPHGRLRSDDGPSPYVGQIDLENGIPNADETSRSRRKAKSRYSGLKPSAHDLDTVVGSEPNAEHRVALQSKRHSALPKAPPGGSYRIPEKGQVQIVIKNQHKTAVKLFLVPYDLAGMEPGTKTFVRQRSYSTGPIIDHVPQLSETDPMSRPILRYLVHLHICCPSKGKFYLYRALRVVFANRVSEGKEKLRYETTWPEPRFTPYKPVRVLRPPAASLNGPMTSVATEKAFRRRSLGVSFSVSSGRTMDIVDGLDAADPRGAPFSNGAAGSMLSGNSVPMRPVLSRDSGDDDLAVSKALTARGSTPASRSLQASRPSSSDSGNAACYEKLAKGDLGYGGNLFNSPSNHGIPGDATEGFLSQRLRSLGVKTDGRHPLAPVTRQG